MHRDFLRNFTVNGQQLPEEVIDAIMAENGRDIEAAKKAYAGGNSGNGEKMFTQEEVNRIVSERLTREKEKLQAIDGSKDMEQLRAEITRLQGDLTAQAEAHKQELVDTVFNHALDTAIKDAKGRDGRAIRSMLDLDALKDSEDQGAAIKTALEGLRRDSGWLFEAHEVPPPYAPGTGTGAYGGSAIPVNFADAFKPPTNY